MSGSSKILGTTKALLRNKLDKADEVILCNSKTKNVDIAIAMARLFNAVSVQKNKSEWSSYFVTMPKANCAWEILLPL